VKQLASTLLDGLRAVLLRHPRGATITAGADVFIALIAVQALVSLGIAWADTEPPLRFSAAGVLPVLGEALLTLVAAWLLVALAGRRAVIWGAAAILLAASIATALIVRWPLTLAVTALARHDYAVPALLLELLSHLWWFLVLLVFAHWLAPLRFARPLLAAVLAYAVSAAAWWWLPAPSLLANVDDEDEVAGTADAQVEDKGEAPPAKFDTEAVMFGQRELLDAALQRIAPRQPGKPNLYVVAFAGDAEEDVFHHEAEYAERLFAQRFDAAGRVLVLENNAATVATRPLATWTNLTHALDAIAKKMDPAEDILLLYLTTHGSQEHELLVDLDPLPLYQIAPEDLADALKTTPRIRWKVLVVNACYSGGFVDALRDDSTMVISSARADRTSFGCGAQSDFTWFGKAFLVEALNRTTSLREAFDLAARSVAQWEAAEQEEPSEPQLATTPAIEAKLAAWRTHLPLRPAVPLAPAAVAAP
jgi:hypothetical protein